MMISFVIILLLIIITIIFLRQPKFGRLPAGERLELIKSSPNYKNGSFQNISHTPNLAENVSYSKVFKEFFFDKKTRVKPAGIIPSVKTDLINLDLNKSILVWFGHSSYFMQVDGKRILVDPVFSGHASPFSFSIKAFKGTNIYTPDDMPAIDLLIITHDHWDHLDYDTVKKLRPKVSRVVCGLGTGAHLERWGYNKNIIIEKDWNERIELEDNFTAEDRVKRNPVRVVFNKVVQDKDGLLVLSDTVSIPPTIEEIGELSIQLFFGDDKKTIKGEVVSPKKHLLFAVRIISDVNRLFYLNFRVRYKVQE